MTKMSGNEYELLSQSENRPSRDVVEGIVELCLSAGHFTRVAVLRSPFLRNRRVAGLLNGQPFCLIPDAAAVGVADWVSACHSQGHLSVWFLVKDWSRLREAIERTVDIGSGKAIAIGTFMSNDPFGENQKESLNALLKSGDLDGENTAVCFSHDGEQLYRIEFAER